MMSNFFDDFRKQLEDFETKVALLDTVVEENKLLTKTVSALELRVEDLENRSRQQNVEISGNPEANNENLIEIVKNIGKYIDFDIDDNHVVTVHRVQPFASNTGTSSNGEQGKKRPKNIILKFT